MAGNNKWDNWDIVSVHASSSFNGGNIRHEENHGQQSQEIINLVSDSSNVHDGGNVNWDNFMDNYFIDNNPVPYYASESDEHSFVNGNSTPVVAYTWSVRECTMHLQQLDCLTTKERVFASMKFNEEFVRDLYTSWSDDERICWVKNIYKESKQKKKADVHGEGD